MIKIECYFTKVSIVPKCVAIYTENYTCGKLNSYFDLSYEASLYYEDGLMSRLKKCGNKIFDYEKEYLENFIKFNSNIELKK